MPKVDNELLLLKLTWKNMARPAPIPMTRNIME